MNSVFAAAHRRYLLPGLIAVGLMFAPTLAHAQKSTVASALPRGSDGHPDLQGVWTNASLTTLERPARYASTTLTPEEVEQARRTDPMYVLQVTDDAATTPKTGLLNGKDLRSGDGYNTFWIDPGTQFGVVRGKARTAWITDPADGRIPYNPAGRALAAANEAKMGFSDPEARPLADQCLATTGRTGPPMVGGLYNNHYQIVATQTHVVIYTEMISHARIVPLGVEHMRNGERPLFGDSIGRWEGDTLVIETTHFHLRRAWQALPAYLSENAKVTERLTRVSPTEILYAFTVEDPVFYARAWSGEETWRLVPDQVYEYACHEGNYAMTGILQGARVREKLGLPLEQGTEE